MLRERPERIVRYYAYVPDARDPLPLRGETTHFLHDIVLSLEREGFRVGESLSRDDRAQLINRLHRQLQLLSENWRSTGQKTIILVDGLDHIERELKPHHSLLRDLPLPEQVPEGVLFVLGSQTDQLDDLPSRIQHMIRQPGRWIEMSGLSRDSVYRVLEKAQIRGIDQAEVKDRIFELSAGHPLALSLVLNRLRDSEDNAEASALLEETEAYTGDIEDQYHTHWRRLESDDGLVHLLGLAARLRSVIDLKWIEQWADRAVVGRFRRHLAPYFRREAGHRWYFFHNSFRLFVIRRTLETAPGEIDPSRDLVFHRELADHCSTSPGYWAWEELYHRVAGGQDDVVLQRATPAWFRAQLAALRPIDAIEGDVRLAVKAVATKQDVVALARLNFIMAEMGQRSQHLEDFPLIDLLLKAGEHDIALTHIRDGNRLRISQRRALRLSRTLRRRGLDSEARRLFDLSEPLDLLNTAQTIVDEHQREKAEALEVWASVAPVFRDLDEIVRKIARLRYRLVGVVGAEESDDRTTRSLRNNLLFQVGVALLGDARWEDLARVLSLYGNSSEDQYWWFWLHSHAWRHAAAIGDAARAEALLRTVHDAIPLAQLSNEQRVALAEASHQILGDITASRLVIAGVPQPEVVAELVGRGKDLGPFLQRFRLNRLLSALGEEPPLREAVPLSEQAREEGSVYFERGLCIIARIWGRAWRGHTEDPTLLIREADSLLHLFYRDWEQTRYWVAWHSLLSLRPEFYRLLIDAISQHGGEAVEQLAGTFEEEWRGDSARYWPADLRRSILMSLFDAGVSPAWVAERLDQIEPTMFDGQDISGQLLACGAQAEAWFEIGNAARARALITRGIQLSLGVGYRKDYQVNDWIHWLRLVNAEEPEHAAERLLLFANAIPALEETTEGRASALAATELLKAAFAWSPRRGVALFHYFADHGVIATAGSLADILSDRLDAHVLDADVALHTTADFLMPISRAGDVKLAAALLRAISGTAAQKQAVRYLVHQSSTRGLPSARRRWRRGLAIVAKERGTRLEELGLAEDDLRPDRDEGSSSLRLSNGSELSSVEVNARATSLAELETLIDQEAETSAFNWEPLLKRFSEQLTVADIERLVPKVQKGYRAPFALAVLSQAATRVGAHDRAWALGLQALDLSHEYGWSKWMDGGSRIAAFTALIRAHPTRGRRLAYETLERDGGGGAGNLDEILPLLEDLVPVKAVWAEVEQYVRVLFEGLPSEDAGPLGLLEVDVPHDTANQAIVDIVASYLDHPARLVAQAAQRACAKLLLKSNPEAHRAVQATLDGGDGGRERALHLLEAVGRENPSALAPFESNITALTASGNFGIRWAAQRICMRCAWSVPARPTGHSTLPELYDIILPPPRSETLWGGAEIRSELVLPDTRDVRELISPFDIQFDAVAHLAGIPRTNVYHRAAQLMEALSPRSAWSAESERRTRSALDRADLKFTFLRPRAVIARRALFYIIGELLDAGRLTTGQVEGVKSLLTFDDVQLLLLEPSPRPMAVPPIPRRERYSERHAEWVDRIDESHAIIGSELSGGWKAIAEHTTLKILEWEVPTETRTVSIAYGQDSESPRGDVIARIPACSLDDYWTVRVQPLSCSLAIRNDAFMYDSFGASWIALNPEVARALGWRPGKTPLSWDDREGEGAAQTVWWSDGGLQHYPPLFDDEIGEGWLVLVSFRSFQVLREHFSHLTKRIMIRRQFRGEHDEVTRVREWTERAG